MGEVMGGLRIKPGAGFAGDIEGSNAGFKPGHAPGIVSGLPGKGCGTIAGPIAVLKSPVSPWAVTKPMPRMERVPQVMDPSGGRNCMERRIAYPLASRSAESILI